MDILPVVMVIDDDPMSVSLVPLMEEHTTSLFIKKSVFSLIVSTEVYVSPTTLFPLAVILVLHTPEGPVLFVYSLCASMMPLFPQSKALPCHEVKPAELLTTLHS